MEGDSEDTTGKRGGFLGVAPLAFDDPGGSGGEGENGVVWKMSENGGFVSKYESGWCLRWIKGIKVLSSMRVPKMKGEGIAGGGKGLAIRRKGESFYGGEIYFGGFSLVRFEGFLRTDKFSLGFGNAGLDCKEILGSGRAIFDREFVGVLGTSE